MLNTEKVFDMLPNAVEIYDKLDIDGYRKKIAEENKGKTVIPETIGIGLLKYILVNTPKVKEDLFSIVAIFDDKTVAEVKAQSLGKTIAAVKSIFEDKDLMDFFNQAVR